MLSTSTDQAIVNIISPTNIFKGLNFDFKISSNLVHDVFFIILLIYGIIYLISFAILFYHWERYGMGHRKVFVYGLLFVIVSLILFLIAYGLVTNI